MKVGFFRFWIRAAPTCSHVLTLFARVLARRRGPQQLQCPLRESRSLQVGNERRRRLAVSGRRGREGWGPRRGLAGWPRVPQTVLCSSTRRKWWRRILRRRLCVDLHNSDTASVRLDGSTHDGAGQRAQSRCSCPRRGAFFPLVWARLTTGDQRRRGPCRLQLYLDTYRVVGDAQNSLFARSEEVPPFQ